MVLAHCVLCLLGRPSTSLAECTVSFCSQTAGGQLPALAEALTTMTDTSQPAMNIADTMANLHLGESTLDALAQRFGRPGMDA